MITYPQDMSIDIGGPKKLKKQGIFVNIYLTYLQAKTYLNFNKLEKSAQIEPTFLNSPLICPTFPFACAEILYLLVAYRLPVCETA